DDRRSRTADPIRRHPSLSDPGGGDQASGGRLQPDSPDAVREGDFRPLAPLDRVSGPVWTSPGAFVSLPSHEPVRRENRNSVRRGDGGGRSGASGLAASRRRGGIRAAGPDSWRKDARGGPAVPAQSRGGPGRGPGIVRERLPIPRLLLRKREALDLAPPDRRQRGLDEDPLPTPDAGDADRRSAPEVPGGRPPGPPFGGMGGDRPRRARAIGDPESRSGMHRPAPGSVSDGPDLERHRGDADRGSGPAPRH